MGTIHMNAEKGDIAKTVLMPGDPNRCKFIAETYLENPRLINTTRGMTAYTGTYKGKEITVFPSGMGIPSACIYTQELFQFYDVDQIIRIGTAGAGSPDVKIMDVVLSNCCYTLSTYPLIYDNDDIHEINTSSELNDIIIDKAKELNISLKVGKTITNDVFDVYADDDQVMSHFPKDNYYAKEMEGFGICYIASKFNKKATVLLSIVDSPYEDKEVSSEDREHSLTKMIELALESA